MLLFKIWCYCFYFFKMEKYWLLIEVFYLMVGNEVDVLIVNVIKLVIVVIVIVVLECFIIVLIFLVVDRLCGCWLSLLIMMNMLLMLILRIKKGSIFIKLIKGIWSYILRLSLDKILRVIVKIFLLVSKVWLVNGLRYLFSMK